MRNLDELTNWINDNSLKIINTIPQNGVNKYLFIQKEFVKGDIKDNQEFQKKFKDFYGLNAAHFTKQFYENYFPKFDELKGGKTISKESIIFILEDWYKILNKRGLQTIQFSFLSKLIHTIDNDKIIYDSQVRKLFELKAVSPIKCIHEKIDIYLEQYEQLDIAYRVMLDSRLLDSAILLFDKQFPQASEISKIKKLDFIFWKAGKLWSPTSASVKQSVT